MTASLISVPPELASCLVKYHGDAGREWTAALPDLAARYQRQWGLRLDGTARHGVVALVLPVVCQDGTPAALKLQMPDPAHPGEAAALRAWDGRGAVRLLDEDPATGTMLLERLDAGRPLTGMPDDLAAVRVIGELLVRLNGYPAPPGLHRLSDIAERMLAAAPSAAPRLADPDERALLLRWAGAVGEVAGEAGDRLLHWDLHYDNVLAGEREPWLAIDPKPLVGDPCFELLPALYNRWDEVAASGDAARAVRRRFDVLVEILDLERQRAVAWTLGRVLQDALWDIEDGATALDPTRAAIARALHD